MAHNRNKGFSIIELIVTIAIMAIVTAGAVGIYSWLRQGHLKTSYQGIATTMNELRSDTMSKGDELYASIYKDGKNYYSEIVKVTTTVDPATGAKTYSTISLKKTSLGRADIYMIENTSGNRIKVSDTDKIVLKYSRSSGEFKNKMHGDINMATGSIFGVDISRIDVEYGTLSKTIKLIPTGKFKIS